MAACEGTEEGVVLCESCGIPMDIASMPPFAKVICPSCGTENRVKKHFGIYELTSKYAIGGMSTVFIARDETLGREVALKILSEEYSEDEKRIAAFQREAHLTASFSHPNLVSVYTTGKAFGRFYIAMEFVHGGHFEEFIEKHGKISEAIVLPLAIQVAEVLKSAQSAGLIHRDVKPGNIMLDTDGNAKLVDFGLALVTKGGKAKADEIWATTYYVPPETLEGKAEDFRADMYAFGATFYHALAGKPPCEEKSMATTVLREAKKQIAPLKSVAPDLSDETCALIDRAMAYHPVDRFETYDDLLAALKTAFMIASGEIAGFVEQKSSVYRFLFQSRSGKILTISAACACFLGALILLRGSGSGASQAQAPIQEIKTVEAVPAKEVDVSNEIAADYLKAKNALLRGKIRTASRIFSKLFEHPEIQEPSKTWVGLHSIVTLLMREESSQADVLVSKLCAYQNDEENHGNTGKHIALGMVLNGFAETMPFRAEILRLGADADERNIACLIAGLKNWHTGAFAEAMPFFEFYAAQASLREDLLLHWYQEKVAHYLHDGELLRPVISPKEPISATECDAAIAELDGISKQLRIQGITQKILSDRRENLSLLAQKMRISERPKPMPMPKSEEDHFSKMMDLKNTYRFGQFAQQFETSNQQIAGYGRDSLIAMCRAAEPFLADMQSDLSTRSVSFSVQLRDSTPISSIGFSDGQLFGKRQDGKIQKIRWQDFTPEQLIELYRNILKTKIKKDDQETWQRHEAAIAFDWLVGDRKRALAAASRLCEDSESFSEHWEMMMQGLPKQ